MVYIENKIIKAKCERSQVTSTELPGRCFIKKGVLKNLLDVNTGVFL